MKFGMLNYFLKQRKALFRPFEFGGRRIACCSGLNSNLHQVDRYLDLPLQTTSFSDAFVRNVVGVVYCYFPSVVCAPPHHFLHTDRPVKSGEAHRVGNLL